MTQEQKPVLLTEAEAIDLQYMSSDARVRYLRERGLIAEEPVDPLLIEAREICAAAVKDGVRYLLFQSGDGEVWRERLLGGCEDDTATVKLALAALKRGREIEREASNG